MKLPSPIPSHRGSALLIVIGMVSFMVISSVAFSIYMRTSRLPSNYLRRGTSARLLLKSALAGAIERIDGVWRGDPDASSVSEGGMGFIEGIYDDYYPGLNARGDSSDRGDWPYTGNRFVNHVFTPFSDIVPPDNPNEPSRDQPIPVATLTLEGLAYLPPAIINEVRLQSHRTRTACWCNLAYEYGRYAFCAVDVSDCFDVNKLRANSARTSAARQRIGFSTLFADDNAGLSSFETASMRNFDSRMNGVGNIPLVSLADFNLFFGKSEFSPFCSYVGQKGNLSVLGEGDRLAANSLFSTDTWFPPTNTPPGAVVRRFDLSGAQPFDPEGFDPRNNAAEALDLADKSDEIGSQMRVALGGASMVCLYDYLDADNVPTSFALPTTETAPMVCALALKDPDSPTGAPRVRVSENADKAVQEKYKSGVINQSTGVEYENTVTATPYELTWQTSTLLLQGQVVFPFMRVADKERYATSFKVEALTRVFLAPSDLRAYVSENSPLVPKEEKDWKEAGGKMSEGRVSAPVTITRGNSLAFAEDPEKPADAVRTFSGSATIEVEPSVLFYRIEHTCHKADGTSTTTTWYTLDGTTADAPLVLNAEGVEDAKARLTTERKKARAKLFDGVTFSAGVTDDQIATRAAGPDEEIDATELQPQAAVWVRLLNEGGDDDGCTVDVVPAWGRDDSLFTKGRHNPCEDEFVNRVTCNAVGESSEPHAPLLRFTGEAGKGFPYGKGAVEKTAEAAPLRWPALLAIDPRYNYSPQDWFKASSFDGLGDVSAWLNAITPLLGQEGRDRDIFMFTSDQEYLQSMGELQFLPFLHELGAAFKTHVRMSEFATLDLDYQPDRYSDAKSAMDAFMPDMWKTYSAPDGDAVYTLGLQNVEFVSSSGDFRINPFTSDDRIFRAAIANTPYDWFVASTNEELNLLGNCDYRSGKPTVSDALKHAFNPQTACAKWTDEEVDRICDAVRLGIRAGAALWSGSIASRPGWEHYFDRLAWFSGKGDEQKTFMGVNLQNPLHGVDRKFLHGFWRECFQNRQQLFLVFIRAEPLTVGGSGRAALANTQLGARGVALVWRDPEPPQYQRASRPPRTGVTVGADIAPHRTRVLFYHQFD